MMIHISAVESKHYITEQLLECMGRRFNLISLKLAENVTESINYESISEDQFNNMVVAQIK